MKKLTSLLIVITLAFTSFAQEKKSKTSSDVTTYYFIRHAEKDRSNPSDKDPHLTEEGWKRAQNWSLILGNIQFDLILATNYNRTIETATPMAEKNNLSMTAYYMPKTIENIDKFLKDTQGKTVLVVGHSNTTPAFVNAVIKQKKYEDIDDSNNGNLYIVTIIGDKIVDQVLTIN